MCAPARRLERRPEIIQALHKHFLITEVSDLSATENTGQFLESTGAIVFDHLHKTAYATVSARCDEALFTSHVAKLGYQAALLHATDENGMPIYHTNVFMAIQTRSAVICGEALPPHERHDVFNMLRTSGRSVIDISYQQMRHFAGNMLELKTVRNARILVLSKNAFSALRPNQRKVLAADKKLVPIAIPTIEMVGGGSVRCMIAELFLPHALPGGLQAS